MSTADIRPFRYMGLQIARSSGSFAGSGVRVYIDWLSTNEPGAPFGIRCFATSTHLVRPPQADTRGLVDVVDGPVGRQSDWKGDDDRHESTALHFRFTV